MPSPSCLWQATSPSGGGHAPPPGELSAQLTERAVERTLPMAQIQLTNPTFYKNGEPGHSEVVGFESGVTRVARTHSKARKTAPPRCASGWRMYPSRQARSSPSASPSPPTPILIATPEKMPPIRAPPPMRASLPPGKPACALPPIPPITCGSSRGAMCGAGTISPSMAPWS